MRLIVDVRLIICKNVLLYKRLNEINNKIDWIIGAYLVTGMHV